MQLPSPDRAAALARQFLTGASEKAELLAALDSELDTFRTTPASAKAAVRTYCEWFYNSDRIKGDQIPKLTAALEAAALSARENALSILERVFTPTGAESPVALDRLTKLRDRVRSARSKGN